MKKLTLIITLLSIWAITNAQTDENSILDTTLIQKNELKLTPGMEEMLITKIKHLPENSYSDYGIENKSQLENLQLGKPVPSYRIVNEELRDVHTWNVHLIPDEASLSLVFIDRWNLPDPSDRAPLSLVFSGSWNVPVLSHGEPLSFATVQAVGEDPYFAGRDPYFWGLGGKNTIEHLYNYEHKDLVIGSISRTTTSIARMREWDYLIIRKENKVLFVQVYDEATGEYFTNEYNFSEVINHIKKMATKEQEARMRYYESIADKSQLKMTPELTEMLINQAYSSHINTSDEMLPKYGIKDRAQLEHLHLGKPMPEYRIVNEKLTFTGYWEVLVMSNGEPLFLTTVKLENDGQYRYAGSRSSAWAEILHNYEHKGLIIGLLELKHGWNFLILRKDNQDIFVRSYDHETGEYFKNEYTLSELINLLKK